MSIVFPRNRGQRVLLQGNEAIARGALEGHVQFATAYPGNPSSEILESLALAAKEMSAKTPAGTPQGTPLYVEWSTNEKVALEAAAAASFCGLNALVSMKQNGVNVASDFLTNLTLSGTKGGLVLVSCDDPAGISSTNEEDARTFAPLADIPLLEPATPQEALEMTRFAFELSRQIENVVMIRSISRLSHTRTDIELGSLPTDYPTAYFDTSVPFHTFPIVPKHDQRQLKLDQARERFEKSPFNLYHGPLVPELLIIASGCAWDYTREALELLSLNERAGLIKLGTTWPLPQKWLLDYLGICSRILFLEDVDPFIETRIKALCADHGEQIGVKTFFGKDSGHVAMTGEQTPATIISLLKDLFQIEETPSDYREKLAPLIGDMVPQREFGFCPGCPHRASYYAMKTALAWDDRQGFVSGDIGCYTMGIWPTGFNQVKSVHAMGSGSGLACGFGKLEAFGFNQPVVTVCGDSTFFHAGVPALINAKFNHSDIMLLILDNGATAMTGFQPHPGTGSTAMGEEHEPIDLEALCRSLGVYVEVADPYNMIGTAQTLYGLLQNQGPRVLILKRKCALVQGREGGFPYRMQVNPDRCLGESCGCGRYCTRIFRCPGLIWNAKAQKAQIDEVICVGCGICADICPQTAILKENKEKPV